MVATTTAGLKEEKEMVDVELAFQLPAGSFATVLIREFLGQEPVSWAAGMRGGGGSGWRGSGGIEKDCR